MKDAGMPEVSFENKKENFTLEEYFPFLKDTALEYEGLGMEFAEKTVFFEYVDGNKAQIKVINPGTNIITILEKKDGAIKEIFSEGEFYHIEKLLDIKPSIENILLKEPLEIGNSWETVNGEKREITGIDIEIETPYEVFKTIEVTTFKKDSEDRDYYAPGLGLVASVYKNNDMEIKSLLKSVKKEGRKIAIEKYYPIDIDSDLVYVNDVIDFYTNANIEEVLEEILKNPPSKELIPLISPKTKLNSIKLDRNNWKLRVDFSPELITDMNYGGAMESMVLSGIVNTLGRFYDVDGISITIDGRAYESGHFYFKEDEVLDINLEGKEEFIP